MKQILFAVVLLAATCSAQSITIDTASPTCTVAGSRDLVLTLYGAGFAPGDLVVFGSRELKPSYLSSRRIRVTVPAELLIKPGPVKVFVFRPDSPAAARKQRPPRLEELLYAPRCG